MKTLQRFIVLLNPLQLAVRKMLSTYTLTNLIPFYLIITKIISTIATAQRFVAGESGFSKNVVVLEIHAAHLPNLTMVDLPGLMRHKCIIEIVPNSAHFKKNADLSILTLKHINITSQCS